MGLMSLVPRNGHVALSPPVVAHRPSEWTTPTGRTASPAGPMMFSSNRLEDPRPGWSLTCHSEPPTSVVVDPPQTPLIPIRGAERALP
jgi:hypothetical protein